MQKVANISILIDGMTCTNCENRIEDALRKTAGVQSVKVSYVGSRASVTYDASVIDQAAIEKVIESLDYQIKRPAVNVSRVGQTQSVKSKIAQPPKTKITQVLGLLIIIGAFFLIANHFGLFNFFNSFPQAEAGMGYGLLFLIGLLTSVHCIAMCGGINLSQCMPQQTVPTAGKSRAAALRPSILYNTGRVISYTVIGGLVGLLGSVVSFSGWAKGLVAIAAGIFMVIMGLNMLNIFPWLRRFSLRMPKIFARKINDEKSGASRGPFYIGLLNGLMPCGPLQAMQLYALSTGSPLKGALSMLVFSLGTVPLMFGLGALSSLLSKKFTQKMMQVSAVLVVILGIVMFQNGIGLSGLTLPAVSSSGNNSVAAQELVLKDGVQQITTELKSNSYAPITVTAGIPVKWTIHAAQGTVNGCNGTLVIPSYNIEQKLAVGDNVIEFTPEKAGVIPYSCWMGMIRSQITVVAEAAVDKTAATAAAAPASNLTELTAGNPGTGSCCTAGSAGPGKTVQDVSTLAEIVNGKQQATITVDSYGYSPQTLYIQRGLATDISFDVKQATSCNSRINIPALNIQMDLTKDQTIPTFTAGNSFTISCWMNMVSMNVVVVDDLAKVDINALPAESSNVLPAGGSGCCG